jgi:tetratricopeptide (TPR) repeat protein
MNLLLIDQLQYKHASFYLQRLRELEARYDNKATTIEGLLADFDYESGQILQGQTSALELGRKYAELADFCGDYVTAGHYLLRLRLTPRQRIAAQTVALKILRSHQKHDYLMRVLLNISSDYAQIGEYENAIQSAEEALTLANALNNTEAQNAIRMNLGTIHLEMRQGDKAVQHYGRVQDYDFENKMGKSAHLNGLGNSELLNGNFSQAIVYFEEALLLAEELGNIELKGIYLNGLSVAYMELRNFKKALDYSEAAIEAAERAGNRLSYGNCIGQRGNIHFQKKQYRQAVVYYLQAIDLVKDIDDKLGIANRYNNLGNVYTVLGDSAKALEYLTQAHALFIELGNTEWVGRVEQTIQYNRNPSSLPRRLVSRLFHFKL